MEIYAFIGEDSQSILSRPGSASLVWAIALGLVLFGILIHHFFSSSARVARNKRRIFREFAGANALTPGEEKTLFRVARHGHLDNPSVIFVRRALFESAVRDLAIVDTEVESIRRKVYSA